eukprot:TRINITY_DN135104_c0_g1_i1.p3 TRINITY_DN135104_c0_g1~~TRINITY_DN135104_c0_g1_i1.p3  ORF type:complete len:260 (-),score=19.47 TRINITY_DN135104_c0_g1_i1:209-988(-)
MEFKFQYFLVNIGIGWEWNKEELFGSPPCPRRGHSCVYFKNPNPSLVLLGGVYGYSRFLREFYTLDLEKRKWAQVKAENMPPAIAWHSANVINNKMFVIGGLTGPNTINEKLYVYDAIAKVWEIVSIEKEKLAPRYSHATVVFEDQILIFGGVGANEERFGLNEIWVLTNGHSTHSVSELAKELNKCSGFQENRSMKQQLFSKFLETATKITPSNPKIDLEFPDYISKLELQFCKPSPAPLEPKNVNTTFTIRKIATNY